MHSKRAMGQLMQREAVGGRAEKDKALKILAQSIFKELRTNGYEPKEILSLSTELISLLTTELKK